MECKSYILDFPVWILIINISLGMGKDPRVPGVLDFTIHMPGNMKDRVSIYRKGKDYAGLDPDNSYQPG